MENIQILDALTKISDEINKRIGLFSDIEMVEELDITDYQYGNNFKKNHLWAKKLSSKSE